MAYPSAIELIFKRTMEDNTEWFVLSKQGYTYKFDDVTEDGLVYIMDKWHQIFISDLDLEYIQIKKREEELQELKNYYRTINIKRKIEIME
jgi:hypothetical protein